jgi:hypothetical protein
MGHVDWYLWGSLRLEESSSFKFTFNLPSKNKVK